MGWPHATDYSSAIQNPSLCFGDAELAQGVAVSTDLLLGLPLSYAGNFATVYKVVSASGQAWAVKCFTRPVHDLRERYQQISRHLERQRRRFAVDFHYLPEGIRLRDTWYPVLKMHWIEGVSLNSFLAQHASHPVVLAQLAQVWFRLATELREARMAHGDLQHGNVLLVPGRSSSALVLRLIDYDGMWVPELANNPSEEVGHPNYQHPMRLDQGGADAEIDRFSHLVIYTALRAVQVGGRGLWDAHDNGENLLFREADFRQPRHSKLFASLLAFPEESVRILAGHLVEACLQPISKVPLLAELVEQGHIRPWTSQQAERLADLFPDQCRMPWSTTGQSAHQAGGDDRVPMGTPFSRDAVPRSSPEALGGPFAQARSGKESSGSKDETGVELMALAATNQDLPAYKPENASPPYRPIGWRSTFPWMRPRRPLVEKYLLRPGMILLAGMAVGVFLVVSVWLVYGWRGRSDRVSTPGLPRPYILEIAPYTLQVGSDIEIAVQLDRPEPTGPLQLQLVNLPEGLTSRRAEVPAGSGYTWVGLPIQSISEVVAGIYPVRVQLLDGGARLEEVAFPLTVVAPLRPRVLDVSSSGIVLEPGKATMVRARVQKERKNTRWNLILRTPSPVPGLLQVSTSEGFRDYEEITLKLSLPLSSPAIGDLKASLVLQADGREYDVRAVTVSVRTPVLQPRVDLTMSELMLKPKSSGELNIDLIRQNHEGEVVLRLAKAPAGITAWDVLVAPNRDRAVMRLQINNTEAWTKSSRGDIRVVALVNDTIVGEGHTTIRLEKPSMRQGGPTGVRAPSPEKVRIPTADGLTLIGSYFASERKTQAPCVLMVHDLGHTSSRSRREWVQLARALQGEGFAVLSLDFRGYGESRAQPVPTGFWSACKPNQHLRQLLAPTGRPPETLESFRWLPKYIPFLVQDLAAARLWLDLKHDEKLHNSRNLIVIGAGGGGQLALIWLACETRRYRVSFLPPAMVKPTFESRDILGGIFLDISEGKPDTALLRKSLLSRLQAEPVLPAFRFYYDRVLPGSVKASQGLVQTLRQSGQHRLWEHSVAGKGKAGSGLLEEDGVISSVVEAVGQMVESVERSGWSLRETQLSGFSWLMPGNRNWSAKQAGRKIPQLIPLNEWGYEALILE